MTDDTLPPIQPEHLPEALRALHAWYVQTTDPWTRARSDLYQSCERLFAPMSPAPERCAVPGCGVLLTDLTRHSAPAPWLTPTMPYENVLVCQQHHDWLLGYGRYAPQPEKCSYGPCGEPATETVAVWTDSPGKSRVIPCCAAHGAWLSEVTR